ncbi:MAG: S1 family peptidase [Stackebrandtia sp.]
MKILSAAAVAAAATAMLIGSATAAHAGPEADGQVRAGMSFTTDATSRCTIGFSVSHSDSGDGFVAAGHCGEIGDRVYVEGVAAGVVAGHSTDTLTWLWVDLDDGWTALPEVVGGGTVSDGQEAPVGSAVCRAGSTTGWHCGTITAKDVTINFPEGSINGVTQTNVCAEPGDTGGPFLSGSSAQGVTIGGSGNCSSGGSTYFYPLSPILEAAGLTLITG